MRTQCYVIEAGAQNQPELIAVGDEFELQTLNMETLRARPVEEIKITLLDQIKNVRQQFPDADEILVLSPGDPITIVAFASSSEVVVLLTEFPGITKPLGLL